MNAKRTFALIALAVVMFAAGVYIHVQLGDFPKGIDVLPDERRYLDIARSLFSGNGLIIRGTGSDFQKILYPLSLFPALLFPNGDDQIRMVNVLNSAYACSTVFPALAIGRKLFKRPIAVVGCMVLAMISPDLMYSMTFMTESLFMPITLWLVYLCWRTFESSGARQLVGAAAAGIICYATYLCKEVAWMFLIAFMVLAIVLAARKILKPKRTIGMMALFVAGFFIPFIVMKLTLFSGLYNSYGQFSFEILLAPYTVLFGLYSIAVDSAYFIVGFGVFPVIFVACTYGEMERQDRNLALFCLVSLLVGLACVVFTISMREDVGHVALRQHLRYVAPLALPLLYLFVKQGAHYAPESVRSRPAMVAALAAATAGFCVLVAAFFGSANLSQGFDNSQFHFMRWLLKQGEELAQEYFVGSSWTLSGIATDDGALLAIEPLNWLCRASVIVFTVIGTLLLFSKNRAVRRGTTLVISAIIAAFMVINSVFAYDYNHNAYDVEQQDIDEICGISDLLAGRESAAEGDVVVVLDESNTGPNNLIDTYLQDGAGAYEYINIDNINAFLYPRGVDKGINDSVDYVLMNSKQHVANIADSAEQIAGDGKEFNGEIGYILYRVEHKPSSDTDETAFESAFTPISDMIKQIK